MPMDLKSGTFFISGGWLGTVVDSNGECKICRGLDGFWFCRRKGSVLQLRSIEPQIEEMSRRRSKSKSSPSPAKASELLGKTSIEEKKFFLQLMPSLSSNRSSFCYSVPATTLSMQLKLQSTQAMQWTNKCNNEIEGSPTSVKINNYSWNLMEIMVTSASITSTIVSTVSICSPSMISSCE